MPSVSSGPVVYEIPCTCGKLLTITAGQAGSQVPCECGLIVDMPTIRELRKQFESAGAAPLKRAALKEAQAGSDNVARRALSILGMALVVVGALTFGSLYLFQRALPQVVDPKLYEWMEAEKKAMDKIPPSELFEEWKFARDTGMGQHIVLPEVVNKKKAEGAWYGAYVGLGICGVGMMMLVMAGLLSRGRAGA